METVITWMMKNPVITGGIVVFVLWITGLLKVILKNNNSRLSLTISLRCWFPKKKITSKTTIKTSSATFSGLHWLKVLITLLSIIVVYFWVNEPIAGREVESEKSELTVKLNNSFIKELKLTKENKYYRVSPAPNPEMVKGNIGDYFYVDLFDPIHKETVTFHSGEYTLKDRNNDLIPALRRFQDEVMDMLLQDGAKIYIRGKADSPVFPPTPYLETKCGRELFSDIWYYPKAEETENFFYKNQLEKKYLTKHIFGWQLPDFLAKQLVRFNLRKEYGNYDLPELRSRYIQCQYKLLFPNVPTYLLQGKTTLAVDPNDRNATLILYIPNLEP